MKCYFTILIYFLLAWSSYAQVTIEPECLLLEADDVEQLYIEIEITNNGSEEVNLVWQFEPASDFPEDWKFQMADTRIDYNFGIAQSSLLFLNRFEPGETAVFF